MSPSPNVKRLASEKYLREIFFGKAAAMGSRFTAGSAPHLSTDTQAPPFRPERMALLALVTPSISTAIPATSPAKNDAVKIHSSPSSALATTGATRGAERRYSRGLLWG